MADNKFPADPMQDMRTAQRTVDELQATLSREALTTASAGWKLPNMAHPDNPDDGVHIYGNGDDLAVLTPSGVVKRIPNPAAAVAIVPNMTAGSIGGSPTMGQYNALYDDAVAIRATVNEMIGKFRAAGFLLT
ncbi:MAG: hypothetical protein ABR585_07845 [Gemmatimonadaceae bacterium]